MSAYGGYEEIPELAQLYDNVLPYGARGDAGFYLDLCRNVSGEVLELGCGTGRVLIPAAEAGCRITGLDFSTHMIEQCRAKVSRLSPEAQERVRLERDDMTQFQLGRRFALIIIPFRPLQHLVTVDEQLRCLVCARKHLEPGGRLVFDVFHPDPLKISGPVNPDEIEDMPESPLSGGRTMRRTFRVVAKRQSEQCNDIELIYYMKESDGDLRRIVHGFPFRYFYRFELEHLLARAGLRVTTLYGDFDRSPFGDSSPEMIFVAERS